MVVNLEAVNLKAVNLEAVDREAVDLQAVNLEVVNLEVVNLTVVDQKGGATGAETPFIGQLVSVGMYTIQYTKVSREMRDWLGVGDNRSWNVCSTRCLQYSVYAILGGCCTWC